MVLRRAAGGQKAIIRMVLIAASLYKDGYVRAVL
jgi:hypothetical protein